MVYLFRIRVAAAAAASSVARAPSNRRLIGQKSGVSNTINSLHVIFISSKKFARLGDDCFEV